MKEPSSFGKDYIYLTEVSALEDDSDFYVELYPYRPDLQCSGSPIKVLHNFDELIDFLENL
ncbi:hypothetical protein J27TS8_44180 [Robertmurraya siralis]|uniref:Uncharacterized protein n=1 Tax=Robertmurraya siralis TaxID=77777 RepID=A0A919WLR7_9BACI|nr:hypothetical protein [Robertmurraya siralis]PAE22406.1 hypothetical protein CHH80_00115 [Bacillus sp. 7504-2]GIN64425.1 hypothetical protein J27TS8_44180 [Robertmurraya siralis]